VKTKKNDKHLRACADKYRDTQRSLARRAESSGDVQPLAPELVTSIAAKEVAGFGFYVAKQSSARPVVSIDRRAKGQSALAGTEKFI